MYMYMAKMLQENDHLLVQCKIQFIKAAQFIASETGIAAGLRSQRSDVDGPLQWAATVDELLHEEAASYSDIMKAAAPMCIVCWALKAKSAPTLLRCTRCQEAVYCSRECQLE